MIYWELLEPLNRQANPRGIYLPVYYQSFHCNPFLLYSTLSPSILSIIILVSPRLSNEQSRNWNEEFQSLLDEPLGKDKFKKLRNLGEYNYNLSIHLLYLQIYIHMDIESNKTRSFELLIFSFVSI